MPFNSQGFLNLRKRLNNLSKAIGDPSEPAKEIAKEIGQAGAIQIESQGSRGGTNYDPLKKSTVLQRKREGYEPTPIGIRKGTMRDYIKLNVEAQINSNGSISFTLGGDRRLRTIALTFSEGSSKR